MAKTYDATQEFKPFANRKAGGQLIEDARVFHPNKKGYPLARGNNKSHNDGPNVRTREYTSAKGPVWTRMRDGKVI